MATFTATVLRTDIRSNLFGNHTELVPTVQLKFLEQLLLLPANILKPNIKPNTQIVFDATIENNKLTKIENIEKMKPVKVEKPTKRQLAYIDDLVAKLGIKPPMIETKVEAIDWLSKHATA